jgi:hypothetical protein
MPGPRPIVPRQGPAPVDELDEVRAQLHEVALTLARVETKLDRALEDVADHERRLRGLTARLFGATGAATGVGAVLEFVVTHMIGH